MRRLADLGLELAYSLVVDRWEPQVARICSCCGKKPMFGNNRSHSMRATARRFNPNVQKVRVLLNGATPVRVFVCTRCLKAGKVSKVA